MTMTNNINISPQLRVISTNNACRTFHRSVGRGVRSGRLALLARRVTGSPWLAVSTPPLPTPLHFEYCQPPKANRACSPEKKQEKRRGGRHALSLFAARPVLWQFGLSRARRYVCHRLPKTQNAIYETQNAIYETQNARMRNAKCKKFKNRSPAACTKR